MCMMKDAITRTYLKMARNKSNIKVLNNSKRKSAFFTIRINPKLGIWT